MSNGKIRPTPIPQHPLIRNERTNAMAAQPPATGKPLIAGTMNRPTNAAAMPSPNPRTHIGYDAGRLGSTSPNTAPQTPPQKHRSMIRGTPSGGTPSVGYQDGIRPITCSNSHMPWWNTRTEITAATNPNNARFSDGGTSPSLDIVGSAGPWRDLSPYRWGV